MKILVFSWRDPKHPLAGGAEQVMHEHFKGWIKGGHHITLFTSQFVGCKLKDNLDGVEIIRNGFQYLGVQLSAFFYYLKHKENFDLIVDQFHGLPFFTPLYVRKKKLAVIQEIARKVWFLNPLPWPINWFVGLVGFVVEPFIFLFYVFVPFMTGSESAKNDVSRFGIPKDNITVVNHGLIRTKINHLPSKEKVKTVVFLGTLAKDKGIEDALKCFSLLKKQRRFQFWVIGRYETAHYKKKITKLVNQMKLGKALKFWGFVTQKKKFELLAKAHVLVNPSIHEGWGLVNIEANSMGTPVVGYKSSGLVDSIKDGINGIICKKNSPKDLAINIQSLLSDKNEYKKLQKKSIVWSKKYLWKNACSQSCLLLEKIYS